MYSNVAHGSQIFSGVARILDGLLFPCERLLEVLVVRVLGCLAKLPIAQSYSRDLVPSLRDAAGA